MIIVYVSAEGLCCDDGRKQQQILWQFYIAAKTSWYRVYNVEKHMLKSGAKL